MRALKGTGRYSKLVRITTSMRTRTQKMKAALQSRAGAGLSVPVVSPNQTNSTLDAVSTKIAASRHRRPRMTHHVLQRNHTPLLRRRCARARRGTGDFYSPPTSRCNSSTSPETRSSASRHLPRSPARGTLRGDLECESGINKVQRSYVTASMNVAEIRSSVDTPSRYDRDNNRHKECIMYYGLYVVPCRGSLVLGLDGGSALRRLGYLPEPLTSPPLAW